MAAEIERIVDKKPIRGRVHYLVVWRGFGEESNTWYAAVSLLCPVCLATSIVIDESSLMLVLV